MLCVKPVEMSAGRLLAVALTGAGILLSAALLVLCRQRCLRLLRGKQQETHSVVQGPTNPKEQGERSAAGSERSWEPELTSAARNMEAS